MDDELINSFKSSLEANPERPRFSSMYKNVGRYNNQEERRKKILEDQKKNRNEKWDHCRGIDQIVSSAENRLKSSYTNYGSYYKPSIYVAGFNQVASNYENVLMLSEWMVEKPSDFYENWYLTPCPKGLRTLLVAAKGLTRLFNKYGFLAYDCQTGLPGGNAKKVNKKFGSCVLDGIYQKKNNTFYILDVLSWNDQNMTNGETEFRQFWIESNLKDSPEIMAFSSANKMHFSILPKIPCDIPSLNQYLSKYPIFENNLPPLDGFLFYHKYAQYSNGETPLVGWLFPYMINEVLGYDIKLNELFYRTVPENYVDQATFIKDFERKLEASRENKKNHINNITVGKKKKYPNKNHSVLKMEVVATDQSEAASEKMDAQSDFKQHLSWNFGTTNPDSTENPDELNIQPFLFTAFTNNNRKDEDEGVREYSLF